MTIDKKKYHEYLLTRIRLCNKLLSIVNSKEEYFGLIEEKQNLINQVHMSIFQDGISVIHKFIDTFSVWEIYENGKLIGYTGDITR